MPASKVELLDLVMQDDLGHRESQRAQGRTLVTEGCGALQKMHIRSTTVPYSGVPMDGEGEGGHGVTDRVAAPISDYCMLPDGHIGKQNWPYKLGG
jgi:hypothetical protein